MHNKKTTCPYKVKFKMRRTETLMILARWCRDNSVGDYFYQYTAPAFHFEKEKDAEIAKMMFRLLE